MKKIKYIIIILLTICISCCLYVPVSNKYSVDITVTFDRYVQGETLNLSNTNMNFGYIKSSFEDFFVTKEQYEYLKSHENEFCYAKLYLDVDSTKNHDSLECLKIYIDSNGIQNDIFIAPMYGNGITWVTPITDKYDDGYIDIIIRKNKDIKELLQSITLNYKYSLKVGFLNIIKNQSHSTIII